MNAPLTIAGLVPAAGSSRRLGQDKRLLRFRGARLLEGVATALRNAGLDPLVVVLEPDSPCAALPGLRDAILAENPAPERGMLSSIRAGLAALPPEVDAVAVLPGDHPFVPTSAIEQLLERFRAQRPLLLVPRYAGRRGHPLLLARALFEEAAACDDSIGLRQLLRSRAADLELLDLDLPGADDDIDRPEDLSKLE